MIEQAPRSPLLSYDEAWLYMATCTHNNKHDWKGVKDKQTSRIGTRIYSTPWRTNNDRSTEI